MEKIGAYTHEEVVNLMVKFSTRYYDEYMAMQFMNDHIGELRERGKYGFVIHFSRNWVDCEYFDPQSISDCFCNSYGRMEMFREPYLPLCGMRAIEDGDNYDRYVYYDGENVYLIKSPVGVKHVYDTHYADELNRQRELHKDEYEAAFTPLEVRGYTESCLPEFNRLLWKEACNPESGFTDLYVRFIHANHREAIDQYLEVNMTGYQAQDIIRFQEFFGSKDDDSQRCIGAEYVIAKYEGGWRIV